MVLGEVISLQVDGKGLKQYRKATHTGTEATTGPGSKVPTLAGSHSVASHAWYSFSKESSMFYIGPGEPFEHMTV